MGDELQKSTGAVLSIVDSSIVAIPIRGERMVLLGARERPIRGDTVRDDSGERADSDERGDLEAGDRDITESVSPVYPKERVFVILFGVAF